MEFKPFQEIFAIDKRIVKDQTKSMSTFISNKFLFKNEAPPKRSVCPGYKVTGGYL